MVVEDGRSKGSCRWAVEDGVCLVQRLVVVVLTSLPYGWAVTADPREIPAERALLSTVGRLKFSAAAKVVSCAQWVMMQLGCSRMEWDQR